MWWNLGILLVSALVSAALAPKPEKPKPATLDEFDAPTIEDGQEFSVGFGTNKQKGANLLWYGDLSTDRIWSKGGKK